MKITLESIRKNIVTVAAKRAELESERRKYLQAQKVADDAAQNAAAGGDISGYMASTEDAKKNGAAAFVMQKQIEGLGRGYTADEIREGWRDYADKYDKDLEKRLKDYSENRKRLWNEYKEILLLQSAALKTRKECAELLDMEEGSREAKAEFPMKTAPYFSPMGLMYRGMQCCTPEVAFFLSSGEASDSELELFNKVLRNQIAL